MHYLSSVCIMFATYFSPVCFELFLVVSSVCFKNVATEFALEPVTDVAAMVPGGQGGKSRRRRRLIVDDVKLIASEIVKKNLSHTDDITRVLELAPPTKRLMLWKEESSVEQLLHCPGRKLASQHLLQVSLRFSVNWCVM